MSWTFNGTRLAYQTNVLIIIDIIIPKVVSLLLKQS